MSASFLLLAGSLGDRYGRKTAIYYRALISGAPVTPQGARRDVDALLGAR